MVDPQRQGMGGTLTQAALPSITLLGSPVGLPPKSYDRPSLACALVPVAPAVGVTTDEENHTMTDNNPHTIACLNDHCRAAMGVAGRLFQTEGINALPAAEQSAIRQQVETFTDFTTHNDPHGERDFGAFEHNGTRIFWKIDYYAPNMEHGSENPADPTQTVRVLTIMLASEY